MFGQSALAIGLAVFKTDALVQCELLEKITIVPTHIISNLLIASKMNVFN